MDDRAVLSVVILWSARVLSIVSVGFLALFVIGDAGRVSGLIATEVLGILLFPVGVVAGLLLSWKWELMGAYVSLVSLAAFYVYHGVLRGNSPEGIYFLAFTSPALLFLLHGLIWRKKGNGRQRRPWTRRGRGAG